MNYLLDTHTFIWSLIEKDKLSKIVGEIIEDNGNTIYVSSVSFWEIAIKFSLKKIILVGLVPEELPDYAIQVGFKIIPLLPNESASICRLSSTLHKDPFDRMLIWQSIKQNLTLISKDKSMHLYNNFGLKLVW